jgi:hypothetical protein
MESVLGGGVLLAVAAALWLVYLVPNWLRRSEYLATERNAVRLQQTIRVLAETAETPEAVRLESAAKARAYEANLRRRQPPVAVGAPVTLQDPADPRVLAATRMRRARIGTTVAIVVAALVLVAQLVVALVAGPAAVSMLVVLVAGGFFVAGVWLQGRLIRAQRAKRTMSGSLSERSDSKGQRQRAQSLSYHAAPAADARAWQPQPLPQPLHQVRREAALRAAAEAQRESDARESEERRVAARAQPVITGSLSERSALRLPSVAQEPSKGTPSRFAAMGKVDDLVSSMPDIDGALARRRAS